MKEEQINALREQDLNLRDALRLDEAELPQMPTDLNAKVMQRVADVQKRTRKATVRRIWPWVAAACVAAFIVVNIAPPKDTVTPQDKGQVAEKVESKQEKEEQPKVAEAEKPQLAEVKTVKKASVKRGGFLVVSLHEGEAEDIISGLRYLRNKLFFRDNILPMIENKSVLLLGISVVTYRVRTDDNLLGGQEL